ncbi:hypothetical protein D3C85_1750220 [compost metagenome]
MTVVIVDNFEVVDVHGNQRQWLAKALGAFAGLGQHLFQAIAIGDGGQGIGLCQFAVFFELQLQLLIDSG